MQDEDNAIGLAVQDPMGGRWTAYGGARALDAAAADNLARCVAAVQRSADEVYGAYKTARTVPPADFRAWLGAPTLASARADTQALAYTALAPGGKLVITLPDIIPAGLKEIGKVVVSTQGSSHLPAHNACGEAIFARLTEWLASGAIKVCTASRTRYVRVLTALLYCLFSQTAWKSFRMDLGAFRMV